MRHWQRYKWYICISDFFCVAFTYLLFKLKSGVGLLTSNDGDWVDVKISGNHLGIAWKSHGLYIIPLQISQALKNIWKVLQVILWAFIKIIWNIVSKKDCICLKESLLIRSSTVSLQTKEGQMRSEFPLVRLESKMPSMTKVWPSDHREGDRVWAWPRPLQPCIDIFKALHSNHQGGGDYMTWGVQTSLEETRHWTSSPMIVSPDSFILLTWDSFQTSGA